MEITYLKSWPAYVSSFQRDRVGEVKVVTVSGFYQKAVAQIPIGVGVLRGDAPHGGYAKKKGSLSLESDLLVQLGQRREPLDLFLVVHLEVDKHDVLEKLGGQEVVALLGQDSHGFDAGLGLNHTGVAVLAVMHHALFVLVNDVVRLEHF